MASPCNGLHASVDLMADIYISKAQDGQSIAARVDDLIALELPSNPTTGYKWAFADIDESLIVVESADYKAANIAVGSGGVERWMLRARLPGTARIELKRLRPWEGDRSIVERFNVTLSIV